MSLMRGEIIGYDADRMFFKFTMVAADGTIVECEISSAAMNDLAGKRVGVTEREALFLRLRDRIENLASGNFARHPRGHIRIFAKHLRNKEGRFAHG